MKTPSQKQEESTAKRWGGTQNSGSGNGWRRKNDVRTPFALIENKTTGKKQITLKSDDLLGLFVNATAEGRTPVLQFELAKRRYVVLDEDDFLEMYE